MDILWTKSGFHICFHVQTLSYWTKSGQILDFHVQYMSKSFMIGQGFDRHWTGLDSGWTDLVNFPALGQTLDRGWTWFGFCVQALSNQPLLRSTEKGLITRIAVVETTLVRTQTESTRPVRPSLLSSVFQSAHTFDERDGRLRVQHGVAEGSDAETV